jgi:hypothetical protein
LWRFNFSAYREGDVKIQSQYDVGATGLLGTVIFAALVLAVQEHHPLPAEVAKEAMQTSGEVLPNANPVEPLSELAG